MRAEKQKPEGFHPLVIPGLEEKALAMGCDSSV